MLLILLKIKDLIVSAVQKAVSISPVLAGVAIGYFMHGPIKFISTVVIGAIKLILKL